MTLSRPSRTDAAPRRRSEQPHGGRTLPGGGGLGCGSPAAGLVSMWRVGPVPGAPWAPQTPRSQKASRLPQGLSFHPTQSQGLTAGLGGERLGGCWAAGPFLEHTWGPNERSRRGPQREVSARPLASWTEAAPDSTFPVSIGRGALK